MTLREFVTSQGGWNNVRSKLHIHTSDTYYICAKFEDNDWEIKKLLDNKMFEEPSFYSDGSIMVFVQD